MLSCLLVSGHAVKTIRPARPQPKVLARKYRRSFHEQPYCFDARSHPDGTDEANVSALRQLRVSYRLQLICICYLLTEWIASPACISTTLIPCRNHFTPYIPQRSDDKIIDAGFVSSPNKLHQNLGQDLRHRHLAPYSSSTDSAWLQPALS
jgi:hypothetical protein